MGEAVIENMVTRDRCGRERALCGDPYFRLRPKIEGWSEVRPVLAGPLGASPMAGVNMLVGAAGEGLLPLAEPVGPIASAAPPDMGSALREGACGQAVQADTRAVVLVLPMTEPVKSELTTKEEGPMAEHDEDIRLTKNEHHALFVLPEGEGFVEIATIAQAMGCSEETAREALYGLVEKGFVEKSFLDREGQ